MNRKRHIKLSYRLVLGTAIFSIIGVLAAFLVVNTVVRDIVYSKVIESEQSNKTIYAQEIDAWFDRGNKIVETLYHAIQNTPRHQLIDMFEHIASQYYFVESIWVATGDWRIDGEGGFYDSTRWAPTAPDWVLQDRPWWRAAVAAGGKQTITMPYVNAATGEIVSTIVRYIADLNGVEAVIAMNIELTQLYNMVADFASRTEGYLHLIGPGGEAIIHPDPRLGTVDGEAQNISRVPEYAQIIARLRAGEDVVTGESHGGVHSYHMYFPLASTGWSLISVVPTTVTSGPVWQVLGAVLITVAAALVALAVFTMIYMSAQIKGTVKKSVNAFNMRSRALASGGGLPNNDTAADNSFGLDEIDIAFNHNLAIVAGLIQDIGAMHKAHIEGSYRHLMDSRRYEGAYAKIVDGINEMVEQHTASKIEILGNISEIAKGDFDAELRRFKGDEVYINDTINEVKNNIKQVTSDMGRMIEAAVVKGDLAITVDETKYEGGWRKIVKGLNDIAHSVAAPIAEIRDVMKRLGAGRLDERIAGDYPGDFGAIKNAVNATMDNLSEIVGDVSRSLTDVAKGDLTLAIAKDYPGDFEAIKDSINNIVASLHKTMSEIHTAADQVFTGAKQITASSTDLASGASEQAASVEELNASIDMINQQTRQNADNAQGANTLSNTSAENAKAGYDAMKKMLEAMTGIKDSSGAISKIIKVIQDIAFQTDLLALNAAVEAARAGEHGRGFTVVAEEVRNLAVRSQNAAQETTSLIEDSINRVDTGSGIAETTAEALDTIVSNADDVQRIIKDISAASKEQAEAIAQISVGLGQISSVVQSNSAVSEEAAAAAEELSAQAEILRQHVAYFRL